MLRRAPHQPTVVAALISAVPTIAAEPLRFEKVDIGERAHDVLICGGIALRACTVLPEGSPR